MRYKAVIFDLDGVICSTDQYHYQAWKTIADRLGLPFDEKKNDRLRGVSRMESLGIVLEDYRTPLAPQQKQALADEKNAIYRRLLENMTPGDLSPGVEPTLRKLRQAGLLLAIGSSSKNAKFILERLGIEDAFDAVADGNDITCSKPDPEVFLLAASRLGLPPAHCLVVEDARAGVQAALAGGFDVAGIGDAAGDGRATYTLEHIGELVPIVGA